MSARAKAAALYCSLQVSAGRLLDAHCAVPAETWLYFSLTRGQIEERQKIYSPREKQRFRLGNQNSLQNWQQIKIDMGWPRLNRNDIQSVVLLQALYTDFTHVGLTCTLMFM